MLSQLIGRAACLVVLAGLARAEPLDLAARVTAECGPSGFGYGSGCTIELPKGVFEIGPTALGDCVAGTTRNSVTIRGQGPGQMANLGRPDRYPVAATTLRYVGPAGGTMLSVCGSWFGLEDVLLDAKGAAIALSLTSNNPRSAPTQKARIERVGISGAGLGIEITGVNRNDQTDVAVLDQVGIADVEVCLEQDSQQSVLNSMRNIECAARSRGFVLRGGALHCETCYVGNWPRSDGSYDPGFIGFYAAESRQPGPPGYFAHHQLSVSHSHMELSSGRFVVGEVSWNPYPLALRSNYFALQKSVPGEMMVVEWRGKSPVLIEGNIVGASVGGQIGRFCAPAGWRSTGNIRKPEVAALVWTCP